jgi:uncharacterized protein (DUF4415 family)
MARKVKFDDDDAPVISAAQFARMQPMKEVTPGMAKAIKAARGRPRIENPKVVISVRLSAPAKQAWDSLPTRERTKLVDAMERAAIRAAQH